MEKNNPKNNTNTTAQLVKELAESNAFLLDYLSRDLINVQGFAREILPLIKQDNPSATVESISVAIRRAFVNNRPKISKQLQRILSNVQISMKTNIVLFCLPKNAKLPDNSTFKSDDTFFVNQGADEVTVILDKKNARLITGPILLKQDDLALISLRDTLMNEKENFRVTPGYVYSFISKIARAGINLNDILTSYSQATLIVEEKYLLRVYQLCLEVVNQKWA